MQFVLNRWGSIVPAEPTEFPPFVKIKWATNRGFNDSPYLYLLEIGGRHKIMEASQNQTYSYYIILGAF